MMWMFSPEKVKLKTSPCFVLDLYKCVLQNNQKKNLCSKKIPKESAAKVSPLFFMRNFSPEKVADQYDIGATPWLNPMQLLEWRIEAFIECTSCVFPKYGKWEKSTQNWWTPLWMEEVFLLTSFEHFSLLNFQKKSASFSVSEPAFLCRLLKNHATFYHIFL